MRSVAHFGLANLARFFFPLEVENDAQKKAATEDAVKARIETEIRAEFDRIMAAGGKTPNEAAAEALEIIRARAKEGKA